MKCVLLWAVSVVVVGCLVIGIDSYGGGRSSAITSNSGASYSGRGSVFLTTVLNRPKRYTYSNHYYDPIRLKYSRPVSRSQAAFLEVEHNKYRRMVPARDMEYMYWDDELAKSAQRHADSCDFRHSKDRPRGIGENIWADNQSNFRNAVYLWFIELEQFGCSEYFSPSCGHFTQLVQAKAARFGCAAARCSYTLGISRSNILVCQYSAGNVWGKAAFTAYGSEGKAQCLDCPSGKSRCWDGLCA